MSIKTNYHFVYFSEVISEWATKKMHKLYGNKFPNKFQQISLGKEISHYVEEKFPFVEGLNMKVILNQAKEIPYFYVYCDSKNK